MADIYNPWQSEEEKIGLVSPALAGDALPGGSPTDSGHGEMAEMMEEALSILDSQAETIKQLMAMLSGEPEA